MKIVLVAIHYPPFKSSCAVQMSDLADEFAFQNHSVTVLTPDSSIEENFLIEKVKGIDVIRLKTSKLLDLGNFKRAINEFIMPFQMIINIKRSGFKLDNLEGVVWYSPSIFFGPFINFLCRKSSCNSYLILRDIFPEWAHDLGLIRKGPIYLFFKCIAYYQNRIATTVGVQTESNLDYFIKDRNNPKYEVLNNWISDNKKEKSSINIDQTNLSGKKVIIYIGNMGVAQGLDFILQSMKLIHETDDQIGFLFVGRGTYLEEMKEFCLSNNLTNTLFRDEISPDQIPNLLKQATLGLVSLDSRHKSHNIPGKFLSYLQSGLPTIAKVNANTDLSKLILNRKVGKVYTEDSVQEFNDILIKYIHNRDELQAFSKNSHLLANEFFSSEVAVKQIQKSLADV